MKISEFCSLYYPYEMLPRIKNLDPEKCKIYCNKLLERKIKEPNNLLFETNEHLILLEFNRLASELLNKKVYYSTYAYLENYKEGTNFLKKLHTSLPGNSVVIFRVATNNYNLIHALTSLGAFLTETQLTYFLTPETMNLDYVSKMRELYLEKVRAPSPEDIPVLYKLIEAAFQNYPSRFKTDPLLNSDIHIEIYKRWVKDKIASNNQNISALLAVDETGHPCAGAFEEIVEDDIFQTVFDKKYGWFHLYFSHPHCWGKNYYAMITSYGLKVFYDKKIDLIFSETHIDTRFPQYIWQKQGFKFIYSYYTFHLHI